MLLAIDIGNSSICLGLFQSETLTATAKLSADTKRSADEYAVMIRGLLETHGVEPREITAAIISSVVPKLTYTIEKALKWQEMPIYVVGSGVKTGISLKVDDPAQLGADIVVNAAAAVKLYGAPVAVVDIGTATVISAVNNQKALMGVAIAPGPAASLEGLRASAALIPYTELSTPVSALGKNTPAALRAGLVMGHACMIDGMLDRIFNEHRLPESTPVVVTGGFAPLIAAECRHELKCEEHLTLWGLYHMYDATVSGKNKRG
ncbi:MAG: type III pantothenate kinase [Clostridia bacterium]|nr:type III pantothenate kinase [Clostridia bacterium]